MKSMFISFLLFLSETALLKWTDIWWEAPMEGSVLSFLKAEWKVSDTGSYKIVWSDDKTNNPNSYLYH
jgi:hypothetical protein